MKSRREGLALLAAAAVAIAACDAGDSRGGGEAETNDFIVGGSPTTIELHPWQVSLQALTDSPTCLNGLPPPPNGGCHACGGSILNQSWVLTAKHCVSRDHDLIFAGSTHLSEASTAQIRRVDLMLSSIVTDAALLHLEHPLELSGENVQAIPLNDSTALESEGMEAIVSGWGLDDNGQYPDVLRAVDVQIQAPEINPLPEHSLSLLAGGEKDACERDSGGPLSVLRNPLGDERVLVGVVQDGRRGQPCAASSPGWYVRVSQIENWINGVLAGPAPSVQITEPAHGATATGSVNVSATASSYGAISGVRFHFPDGTISAIDDSPPYSASWASTSWPDGPATILAEAVDEYRVFTTGSIQVIVSNPCINGTFMATAPVTPIPNGSNTGISSPLPVAGRGLIGSLSLSLRITHPNHQDLVVRLRSPAGTTHTVHARTPGSGNLVINNRAITTFTHQAAAGEWSLLVQDVASNAHAGSLQSWSMAIAGQCGGIPGQWSGSASPNMATVDNGSLCSDLIVSQTGEAGAVRLDISGTHSFRWRLRGTLEHNGVTVPAFPAGRFPRSSGAFWLANHEVSGLTGDAAGLWRLCIIDTDGHGDIGQLNTWRVDNQ